MDDWNWWLVITHVENEFCKEEIWLFVKKGDRLLHQINIKVPNFNVVGVSWKSIFKMQ